MDESPPSATPPILTPSEIKPEEVHAGTLAKQVDRSLAEEIRKSGGLWGWLGSDRHRSPFHPMTGLLILGSDWVLFSGTVASLGLMVFFLSLFGFLMGTCLTAFAQNHFAKERLGFKLLLKSLVGGFLVGVPFPVGGTLLGSSILLMSGLYGLKPEEVLSEAAVALSGSDGFE